MLDTCSRRRRFGATICLKELMTIVRILPGGVPTALLIVLFLSLSGTARGQAPAPPVAAAGPWTGNASAGASLTSGNRTTSTVNLASQVTYDPKTKDVIRLDGLYLRGKSEDEINADRLSLNGREEHRLSDRTFLFGQTQYLRDRFKEIDYLVSPTVGVGYKLYETGVALMAVDAGVGGVWEKNTGRDLQKSGALNFSEKLSLKLTNTTTVTQAAAGLWKMNDFDDALYTFGGGVAVSISTRVQLKVELLDTFKNKPPSATIKKNDVALLTALVYKF